MAFRSLLNLFLLASFWPYVLCVAEITVLPIEAIVPQCGSLQVLWSEKPPIHLHVQPDAFINISNLVDLGVQQNNSLTEFKVVLPLGQNFTFAFNTIADPFTVYVSNLMTVGPGNTDCLRGSTTSESTSIPHSSTVSSSTPFSKLAQPTSQSAATPALSSSSSSVPSSVSPQRGLSTGITVGVVCASLVLLVIGLVVFWISHRRCINARKKLPDFESSFKARESIPTWLAIGPDRWHHPVASSIWDQSEFQSETDDNSTLVLTPKEPS